MPSGPSATSSTLRGIGSEVNTTSQSAATCATEVPAAAPRSVHALIAAGLRSNTTTSWLVLRMMSRHMGPPMLPTPMKPTFIAVSPARVRLPASMQASQRGREGFPTCENRCGGRRSRELPRQEETTMFIRNAWYVAAWADEVGETPLARRICNEPVVLFRDQQDRVAALLDMCCHRGAPLHMGKVVEEGLQCGYHGLIFDRSGTCVRVPGQEHILERTQVRSFPAVEQDAFVWIWMGDPAEADPAAIVPYPYHND